ncbi:histidinol-phosphate transaminase [Bacteroidales bacterium OttesenSCG-928-J19]|nr:histidinol-phosphate transaminase [Bacteroidales bacterium OttesenSCG-928-J19]
MSELRDRVLRQPIGLRLTKEETLRDENDILLACEEHEQVLACCILSPKDERTVQLRQMAVAPELWGQGLGTKLLHFAEQTARTRGYKRLTLHARSSALGFYEKNGYRINGGEFTEVGIPHYEMNKIMNLQELVRPNIWNLKPYSCARDEFQGEASVYLDANESPYNAPYNRYPDPLQLRLKQEIAGIKGIRVSQIMIGNGSDEPIDLLIRIFCEPAEDNIVAIDPSYGMYQVTADINNIECRKVLLNEDYSLDAARVLAATDKQTKLVFLCSPNNPSGNLLEREEVLKVINGFHGVVVVDEAYIDFASAPSLLQDLNRYPSLVVLQTFSKAWGLASVRCGMAFAGEEIIALFNKVKYPYNINILTQEFVLNQLKNKEQTKEWIQLILAERPLMEERLKELPLVETVYPSDANFILVKVKDANKTYQGLVDKGVIVRNRNSVSLCNGCLRITIGTPEENQTLINELKDLDL